LAVTRSLGRNPRDVKALVDLAETFAIPVVDHWHTHMNFPQDHPLHAGFDPAPYLKDADLILAIESDAPWFPQLGEPDTETPVIQIASDPLFATYPIRGFPVDHPLPGDPGLSLAALRGALLAVGFDREEVESRCQRWGAHHRQQRSAWQAAAEAAREAAPIDMAWASHCVQRIIDPETIVVNEYVLRYHQSCFAVPGSYFHHSPAASLGWGSGAALGAKLARPDNFVVCCVGDGAYLFGVPTAAHWVSRALNLPVLFLVFNNARWNASRQATLAYAPDGWAAKAEAMPLCELSPPPDYELICRASGGHGKRVEDPRELPRALERAVHAVKSEKRQALLNIVCA
jgi:acetolactate synthase-1/2/3 large subunit